MANVDVVREKVLKKLAHAIDLGNGVLRGDRRYRDKTFATAYVDLSDDIVERSRHLAKFQEDLLGESFFEGEDNQRWNSYLYFWAGPKSRESSDFHDAKLQIERDRHYARKFVLTEDDLLNRIGDLSRISSKNVAGDDALSKWTEQLRQSSLEIILEQKPRTQLLKQIENGDAFAPSTRAVYKTQSTKVDPLGTGMLRGLQVTSFRAGCSNGPFSFGDVNLIIGQNGSGKTSLLELIEALYCGRIRRDSSAAFPGIRAKLELPDGTIKSVSGTSMATKIKARNLAWYGRGDHRSSLISEGFTRFNFLDTDAAFRLSSATSVEKIEDDLSRLLVGPETSTQWSYITKLYDDVSSNLRALNERLPSLRNQTELLSADIKRLKETPSQAASFAKTYQASLKALGAKWGFSDAVKHISRSDRARLEKLSRGLRHALAIPSVNPATTVALRARMAVLEEAVDKLSALGQKSEALAVDLEASKSRIGSCHQVIELLQQWRRYCEAGVPDLVTSMNRTRKQIDELRSRVGGLTIGSIPEFPPEYKNLTIGAARKSADSSLSLALTQERRGTESLNQLEQIEQSLQSLKGDLRAIASSIIERTGDSNHCPVCGTLHEQDKLLQKIEALESAEDRAGNEGLRLAVQEAKVRADFERKVIAAVNALGRYAASSGGSDTATVTQLREALAKDQNRLDVLVAELDQLGAADEALGQQGLELTSYEEVRNASTSLFGPDLNPFDATEISSSIRAWEEKLQAEQRTSASVREARLEILERAFALASAEGVTVQKAQAPRDFVVAMNRMRENVDSSLTFLQDARSQVDIPDSKPFGAIQSAIEEAIESFDRAEHAEIGERSKQADLDSRSEELQRTTAQLQDAVAKREHLAKAEEVLRRIRLEDSLEDATREALTSIREQVSYIFGRIHSPSEYQLGDFSGDSLLVTRDGKHPRSANQVSTGQRAALALSIFLALNQSAERAPPIMLIDDPVAHIDDLNALSFFDYLRDLAVSERKQIFFATADSRVAALFQKKFEFLGESRYRQIALSRS